ncbi:MAG: EAL domain-containing protein [Solirubrobacteraceae bacterium]
MSADIRENLAWSPSEPSLVELMTRLSGLDAEESSDVIVDAAAGALGAELAVVVCEGAANAIAGPPLSEAWVRELVAAAERGPAHALLPHVGEIELASASLGAGVPGRLLVARRDGARFSARELATMEVMARLLGLNVSVARATEEERCQRRLSEQETCQRKRAERELAHRSLHDHLTGLANRSLLRERADRALERARHGVGFVAALFVDIDHFKLANDSLDHRRGDRLLVLISQRVSTILALEKNNRHNCTLARPGGDELIVLCEDLVNEHDAVTVAQQIRDSLRAPFLIDGQPVQLTASIGIALAAGGESGPGDADELLRDADVALARAKERGRDRYEIFDEPMRARLLNRVELENELRAGLENDELRLLYQPVVTVSDGGLAAVEALVRWEHPTRGLLGPAEFIPVAEESDLIVALGAWVLDEACEQMRRWRESHPAQLGVRVSVNVSARQLSPELVDTVAAALKRHGVDPGQLALEITETLLIEHTESAREVLAALEQLGVSIVLDDFGTGYSSLRYLNQFPLGQLKLDRSFVADLAREPRSAKIVAATIDMARALGMTVVAEGVETIDQADVLQRLGCDYAQGFLFARPEPPDAVFARIRAAYERDREIAGAPASAPKFEPGRPPAAASSSEASHRRQQVAIGRLAGWLFLIGASIAVPSELIMGRPRPLVVAALALMGLLSGLGCLAVPAHRLSERWINGIVVLGTVEITLSAIAFGPHGALMAPIYLVVATAAAYAFRDRRVIAAHVVLIAAAMTIPLLSATSGSGLPRAVVGIVVLGFMSGVIVYLRELLEGGAAELRELADQDPLTEVGNYRLLHERLDYELLRHKRDANQLAVLLIDLDRFKQVNERRGHAAGDDVLRRVALTLRESVRAQDTVARQGGDEFAILAPDTDAEGAAMLAHRIRDRLGLVQFAGDSVAATIGWAIYPTDGRSPGELLTHADEDLMIGKLRPSLGVPAAAERIAEPAVGPLAAPPSPA